MITIKVKFRPSTINNCEGTVFFQVLYKRIARQITTPYRIFPDEWNCEIENVNLLAGSPRYEFLKSCHTNISGDRELLYQICNFFETKSKLFSADDIVAEFHLRKKKGSFFNFINETVAKLQQVGKFKTAENYMAALSSFKKYRHNEDIMIFAIDSETIEFYQAYLQANGLSNNTISFYMRILRAVYNRAVEKGLTEQNNPFRHVYTGIAKTIKRAISLKDIKNIKMLDLSDFPKLETARDLFLLSFYMRGMSFVDMAFLKKENLKNGIITYRRKKTGQQLQIACERPITNLIEKYKADEASPFLLSIIKYPDKDWRRQYLSRMYAINKALKQIARLAKINIPLTLYVARHSWASIAHSRNIPISIISEGMGHDSETTTQIYLSSLDISSVNKANNQILTALDKC